MKALIRGLICSVFLIAALAVSAYACGIPKLWLSTDPNNFDMGGVGYSSSAPGWADDSYIADKLPFTMYLYNSAPRNKGTAYDIGLLIAVHKGETNGSITIADAFGVETTLKYSDFSSTALYPQGNHGVYGDDSDGIYAVLKPSQTINLRTDRTNNEDITSSPKSWTEFVVKSSSFSEVHFDARTFGGCNVFYNPCSHDVNYSGNPVPEPASVVLLGMGLVGFLARRKKSFRP